MTNLDSVLKSRDITLLTNIRPSQSYGFSSSHVQLWELDQKEGWALKNWCFITVVLEKNVENPLDSKEIKLISPEGNQSWIVTRSMNAEADAPIVWPPDAKSLIGKDPDAGKDWRQKEKGTAEDEMVRWHHRHNGHGFGWTPGVGDGQGGLACCGSWGAKGQTRLSNWTEPKRNIVLIH